MTEALRSKIRGIFEPAARWASLGEAISLPATTRFEFIDLARGLCLFSMFVAHVLAISGAGANSLLSSFYLPGWSTTNFVMLSGIALALMGARKKRNWNRRAFQLVVISYVSNVAFIALSAHLSGWRFDSYEWTEALLLRFPWTISAILLSTAALLFTIAPLEKLSERFSPSVIFAALTLVAAGVARFGSALPFHFTESLTFKALFEFHNPTFVFPLGLLFFLGVWAYSLGAVVSRMKFSSMTAGLTLFCLVSFVFREQWPALYAFRFTATLLVAMLLTFLTPVSRFTGLMSLLGRSSLLVFLLHRLVLELEKWALQGVPSATRALGMFISALLILLVVCGAREKYQDFGRALKRVGL